MPLRQFTAGSGYRYGFNGQEQSKELNGDGNSYTAEFWQYDSRLGRRWNIDPALKSNESPYAAFANNPIWFIDHNGADTTLPSADGGSITLPTGTSNIQTFDASKTYSVGGKGIKPASNGVLSFTYNNVSYEAQYNTKDQSFAYYLGADGSKLGYDINTIPSNIEFSGGERLATAGMIVSFSPRTPVLNRVPPAYVLGAAIAVGAAISSVYHWNNTSNDFGMTRPLSFSYPLPALPITTPFSGHGNRLDNSNPHMLYEFSFVPTDGRTPILKYGIADMYKTGYDRPEKQLPAMMAMYGPSVKWRSVIFTPNRASAAAAEGASVSAHVGIYGEMPRAQILPKPR